MRKQGSANGINISFYACIQYLLYYTVKIYCASIFPCVVFPVNLGKNVLDLKCGQALPEYLNKPKAGAYDARAQDIRQLNLKFQFKQNFAVLHPLDIKNCSFILNYSKLHFRKLTILRLPIISLLFIVVSRLCMKTRYLVIINY